MRSSFKYASRRDWAAIDKELRPVYTEPSEAATFAATEHCADLVLRLPDVRAMLADRLAGRPTRVKSRASELTLCPTVPMRSVPHRVVAVLGLDDEIFPRGPGLDLDDVLAINTRRALYAVQASLPAMKAQHEVIEDHLVYGPCSRWRLVAR